MQDKKAKIDINPPETTSMILDHYISNNNLHTIFKINKYVSIIVVIGEFIAIVIDEFIAKISYAAFKLTSNHITSPPSRHFYYVQSLQKDSSIASDQSEHKCYALSHRNQKGS